jgi:hypothetical protein
MAVGDAAHRQSSFGLDYWLRRCEGFRVDGPDGRIGHVRGIRFDDAAEPNALEVRAGLLGRRTLLIPAADIVKAVPEERRLLLAGSPRLLGSESSKD